MKKVENLNDYSEFSYADVTEYAYCVLSDELRTFFKKNGFFGIKEWLRRCTLEGYSDAIRNAEICARNEKSYARYWGKKAGYRACDVSTNKVKSFKYKVTLKDFAENIDGYRSWDFSNSENKEEYIMNIINNNKAGL